MATIGLYGFTKNIQIQEDISQFLCENYPNIQIKHSTTKDSCIKILKENVVDCLIINQTEEDPTLYNLLKSIEKNSVYKNIPLIGINTSRINLNLNITDSFIANLFVPVNFSEFREIIESNVPSINKINDGRKRRLKKTFSFKEKFDTKKSCYALCEPINDEDNVIVDYKFIEINPEFAEFLDLMIEDIYNGTLTQLFPELGVQFVEMFNATPENGKPLYYEFESKLTNKHFELLTYKLT